MMFFLIALNLGFLGYTMHSNELYQQAQSTYVDLPAHHGRTLVAMDEGELRDSYAAGLVFLKWDNNPDSQQVARFVGLANAQMPNQYNNLPTLLWANARADGVGYSGQSTVQFLDRNGNLVSKYPIPDRIGALSFTHVVLGNPQSAPVGDFGIVDLRMNMTVSVQPH